MVASPERVPAAMVAELGSCGHIPMAGAAGLVRSRRLSSSASAPTLPNAALNVSSPMRTLKSAWSPSPSASPNSSPSESPPPDEERGQTKSQSPNTSPLVWAGSGKAALEASKASLEAPSSTPRTPRSVEVNVEGQEVFVPSGEWCPDGYLEAVLGEDTCTVTVKAGLTGRAGVHVVLRVGLVPEGGRHSRLRFTPQALGDWASTSVRGVEECDIGRFPSRSSSGGGVYPPRARTPPQPGLCNHDWVEDAFASTSAVSEVPSSTRGATGSGASTASGSNGGGVTRNQWADCGELSVAEALAFGPSGCAAEFDCGLSLRVKATCRLTDGGNACLRVEVEGQMRLRPRFRPTGREAAARLYAVARRHFLAGADAEAIRSCEDALSMCDGLNPRPREMGDVLNLLGALYLRRRTPGLAVKCLERALTVRAQRAGQAGHDSEDTALASTLSTLGNAQQMLGNHADALRSFQRSVTILDSLNGVSSIEGGGGATSSRSTGAANTTAVDAALASTLHSLGGAHRALGQNVDARQCYERALAVRERSLGAQHPLNAASLNNLGAVLQQLNDDRAAVRCYQKALAIEAKHYGHDHCMTAATLTNLGSAHERVGDHSCAVECHSRALPIQEKWLGREHPGVAATLHNLGNAMAGAGRGLDAARCHWRALAVWSKTLGPSHPDLAATLHSLGNVYRGLQEPEAAAKCFAGALRIREAALGPTHPETARTRHCAALTGCSLGDTDAALKELQAASKSLLSNLGAGHPWSLQACADIEILRRASQS